MRRLLCRYPFEPWSCTACGADQDRPPVSTLAGLVCERCLDQGRRGEPFIPLTVRMVEGKGFEADARPVLAVSMRDRQVIVEGSRDLEQAQAGYTGETFPLEELPARLAERKHGSDMGGPRGYREVDQLPPAIVTTDAGVQLLAYLEQQRELTSHPLWQWQVSRRGHSAWRPEARSKSRFEFTVPKPVRFGFASQRGGKRRAKGRARWYQMIDLHMFCELPDGWGDPDALELLRFGVELRGWANRNRLPVLAGASSYGSRLLRDARFGGGWRRKVPRATNDRMRALLPGNHYQLLAGVDRSLAEVHKFDQASAHHHAALMTRFPHPDTLEAHGMFRGPLPIGRQMVKHRGPIRVGTDRWAALLDRPGMFVVALSVPELVAIDVLEIPALRKAGRRWQALTSVELEYIREQKRPEGVRVLDVWAAWASEEEDDRLREYALWAGRQLAEPNRPAWLKPTLLATYGMLAVKARKFRNAWRWAAPPALSIGWQTSQGMLFGFERSGDKEREPQTANVLDRALIESRVRLESLRFARQLRAGGMRPVAIYADAVFATGKPPDLLPVPWRYEGVIHDLIFDSPARYRSREEVRLPGTPRGRRGLQRAISKGGDQ